MPTRAEILAEARTWLGTPFHHQGRVKGVGVDCVGLIVGVLRTLGHAPLDQTGYGREPHAGLLEAALEAQLMRVALDAAQPADVLLLRFVREPQHVGLLTEAGGIIHTYERVGRVVEHRLDEAWRRRLVRAYRLPGVE